MFEILLLVAILFFLYKVWNNLESSSGKSKTVNVPYSSVKVKKVVEDEILKNIDEEKLMKTFDGIMSVLWNMFSNKERITTNDFIKENVITNFNKKIEIYEHSPVLKAVLNSRIDSLSRNDGLIVATFSVTNRIKEASKEYNFINKWRFIYNKKVNNKSEFSEKEIYDKNLWILDYTNAF